MSVLLIKSFICMAMAVPCNKTFNYHDTNDQGFNIFCQGITQRELYLSPTTTVTNDTGLNIESATLTDVTSSLFAHWRHLRRFYLDNSVLIFPRSHQIFKFLKDLEVLVIKNTPFVIDNNTFASLANLRELVLSNISLTILETGTLKNLPMLKSLNITANEIQQIEAIPLCELGNLTTLNLSKNKIERLSNFLCIIVKPSLNLNLNDQTYTVKTHQSFSPTTHFGMQLTHLDLSQNKINEFGFALSDLQFLKVMNVESNMLTHLKETDLRFLSNIEEIYMSGNNLSTIEVTAFDNKDKLEHLDLSHNKLTSFSMSKALPRLSTLNLGFNGLESVTSLPTSLKHLILCNNALSGVALQRLNALETLDISSNRIRLDNNTFENVTHMKILLLKNNSIEVLPNAVFNDLKSMVVLDLSQNLLEIMGNDTFVNLVQLEILNMSSNLLQNVNYASVRALANLQVLDISANRLKHIQSEVILSNLPLLSVLSIDSNTLSCEVLSEIVNFSKLRDNVTFVAVDNRNYSRQNVMGIPCNEDSARRLPLLPVLEEHSVLANFWVAVIAILILVVSGFAVSRFVNSLKRRNYRTDEFELLD